MRSRSAEWSSSSMPGAGVAQKAPRQHIRKLSGQPMSRRVDPANPSLETHHLAGDPESRLPKAHDGDRVPPAARPPGRRIRSSEPRIVGRIAGSAGLPAAYPAPQPRWIAPDRPPAPSESGNPGGPPQTTTSRGWRFWRRPKDETSAEGAGAPDTAGSGAPDRETDREAGLAAAFAAAFRLGPEAPPAGANEDQPLPDAAPPPPAESGLDALLEPDSDVEAEGAADPAAAFDQAVEEQAPNAPTADIQSQPVAAEPQAVPAEAERQPEPEPEGSVASEAEAEPEAEARRPKRKLSARSGGRARSGGCRPSRRTQRSRRRPSPKRKL